MAKRQPYAASGLLAYRRVVIKESPVDAGLLLVAGVTEDDRTRLKLHLAPRRNAFPSQEQVRADE